MELDGDQVHKLCGYIQRIITAISVPLYLILVYVITKKSPKKLKIFKRYILINVTYGFCLQIIVIIIHVRSWSPRPLVSFHGIVDIFIEKFGQVCK